MGRPSIYPTGVTIYDKEKAWNGYTLLPGPGGAVLIDMNGRAVRFWKGVTGMPVKLLPGGYIMGASGEREAKFAFQDNLDLIQADWDGNVVWSFNKNEYIKDLGEAARWMARQHHDFQREGSETGYYCPGREPLTDAGNTIILTHCNRVVPEISDKLLMDDRIIEINHQGEIIWEWLATDHFEELGFSEGAKETIRRDPNMQKLETGEATGDWLHINCVSVLGPNRFYDEGDERFNPENLIMDGREANIIFIVSKQTGKIVWKLGPDYSLTPELVKLGQIIGQHHAHMIQRGLPGEGNILVFDNGGYAGYSAPTPESPDGRHAARRHYSRIIEFSPLTLEIVWEYKITFGPDGRTFMADRFFSALVSSAQRLPNGNTLITEGLGGRIFEVNNEKQTVWEYVLPFMSLLYRAYRYGYDWVPQLAKPEEVSITPPDINKYRVPGSVEDVEAETVAVELKR